MNPCREAKIHDALLFFDECEAIFEDREKHGSNHVNMLLTEVEKHEGIIIMATNRSDLMPGIALTMTTCTAKRGCYLLRHVLGTTSFALLCPPPGNPATSQGSPFISNM